MPNPSEYDNESDWMEACMSKAKDEGRSQDQAVAMCLQMWRDKSMAKATKTVDGESYPAGDFLVVEDPESPSTWHLQVKRHGKPDHGLMGAAFAALTTGFRGNKYEGPGKAEALRKLRALYAAEEMDWPGEKSALELPMLLTKAERMADGRTRWQARANTGKTDLEGERFDGTFWDDVLHNFGRVQEAVTRSEQPPDGLPVPILDIAHYSFRLPAGKRNMARAGCPIKLWVDGSALMAQGYFDDTLLGRAAAKAATARPVSERRVSVGVWPDWGRVELTEDGHRIYKGGRNRAYLDHLAMTGHPVDPGTVLEVKSMTQKQDALDVLGAEAEKIVEELEQATTKAAPEGVVVKAEEAEGCACKSGEPCSCAESTEKAAQAEPKPAEGKPADEASFTRGDMEKFLKNFVKEFLSNFKSMFDERMAPIETAVNELPQMKAQIGALSATETAKVKAAIDSNGEWMTPLMASMFSVQRREPVEGNGPEQKATAPDDPFSRMFGGLKKE